MNLESILLKTARCFPEKPMLIFQDRIVTFAEVELLSGRLAAGLMELGLQKGDRIAVGMPNGPEMVIAFMAVTRMGCIAVPLNPVLKAKELQHIFQDSQAVAAVTFDRHAGIIRSLKKNGAVVPQTVVTLRAGDVDQALADNALSTLECLHRTETIESVDKSDLSLIAYTSGTTGPPKGVMLTHGNLISVARAVADFQGRDHTDSGVCFFPLTHITGIVNFMVDSLITGATLILQERFDVGDYLRCVSTYGCTTMGGVSAVFQTVLSCPDLERYDFSKLRRITSGGASLPAEIYRQLSRRFNVPVIEMYGMTENAATLTSNPLSRQKTGSVGISLPGMEVRIVNENGQTVTDQTVGEVLAKGSGIMQGYYHNPERTCKAIQEGWYHTGDMGWMDADGYLYIVDRKDDMINAGAFKIFPREVEEVLFTHPAVLDCAVCGIPDDRLGQVPAAYVVLQPGQAATDSELIRFVKDTIANYKAPRVVFFQEALPRTPQGKVNKRELKEKKSEYRISNKEFRMLKCGALRAPL